MTGTHDAETKGLVEQATWLASGQDDPHSGTIMDLVATITRLTAERDEARAENQDLRTRIYFCSGSCGPTYLHDDAALTKEPK
jgi:hypothetical protein